MNSKYRNRRALYDALCDASKNRVSDESTAMGAHDDEIDSMRGSVSDDFVDGLSCDRLRDNPWSGEFLEFAAGCELDLLLQVPHRHHALDAPLLIHDWSHAHVKGMEATPEYSRE